MTNWHHFDLAKYSRYDNKELKWVLHKPNGELTLSIRVTDRRCRVTVSDNDTLNSCEFPRCSAYYIVGQTPWLGFKIGRISPKGRTDKFNRFGGSNRFQIRLSSHDDFLKTVDVLKKAYIEIDVKDDSNKEKENEKQDGQEQQNSQNVHHDQGSPPTSQTSDTSRIPNSQNQYDNIMSQIPMTQYEPCDASNTQAEASQLAYTTPVSTYTQVSNQKSPGFASQPPPIVNHDQDIIPSQPTAVSFSVPEKRKSYHLNTQYSAKRIMYKATVPSIQTATTYSYTSKLPYSQPQPQPQPQDHSSQPRSESEPQPPLTYPSIPSTTNLTIDTSISKSPSIQPQSPDTLISPVYPLISQKVPRLSGIALKNMVNKVIKDEDFWEFVDEMDNIWKEIVDN